MDESKKKKIFFLIAVVIFLLGIWGTLTRKDPVEKNIGYVYLTSEGETDTLKGYKTEVNYNSKKKEYDYPEIKDKADGITTVNASEQDKDGISVSYSDINYKALYNLYDEEFNLISQETTSLYVPAESDKRYYVSVNVTWGDDKENVKMIYYFSIKV